MAKAKKKTTTDKKADAPADPQGENPGAAAAPEGEEAPINPGGNPRDDMRAALANKHRETRDAPPAPDAPPPWESEEEADAEAERVRAELEAKAASEDAGDAQGDQPPPDQGDGEEAATGPENAPEIVPGSQREINGVVHVMLPGGEEVPYEQVIQGYTTAAQKEAAATQTWQEAARLRREAEEYYNLAQRQPAQPSPEDRKQQIEKLNTLQREYHEALTFGEEETAAQKLTEYHETLAALQTPAAPAPVSEADVERVLNQREERKREEAMGRAFIWYRDEVKDISQVPENDAIFAVKLEQAHRANPNTEPAELFQQAVKATREHLKGSAPKDDWATREARKAAAASTGAGGGSPHRAVEPDRTPGGSRETLTEADMHDPRYNRLQAIMKSRGQSVMTGHAPIAGPGGNRVS